MKSKFPIDENLFCRMVRFYGKNFQLPPLAARIYSYLMFDFEKKGLTFDELVESLSASKSAISTNLHLLISHQFIKELTKIDERKRYFVINGDYFVIRFQEIKKLISEELELIDDLILVRTEVSGSTSTKFQLYKSLLESNINNIKEILTLVEYEK